MSGFFSEFRSFLPFLFSLLSKFRLFPCFCSSHTSSFSSSPPISVVVFSSPLPVSSPPHSRNSLFHIVLELATSHHICPRFTIFLFAIFTLSDIFFFRPGPAHRLPYDAGEVVETWRKCSRMQASLPVASLTSLRLRWALQFLPACSIEVKFRGNAVGRHACFSAPGSGSSLHGLCGIDLRFGHSLNRGRV